MDKIIYETSDAILIKVKDVEEVFKEVQKELDKDEIRHMSGTKEILNAIKDQDEDTIISIKINEMYDCYFLGSIEETNELINKMEKDLLTKKINNNIRHIIVDCINILVDEYISWDRKISNTILYSELINIVKEEIYKNNKLVDDINKLSYTNKKLINLITKQILNYNNDKISNMPEYEKITIV